MFQYLELLILALNKRNRYHINSYLLYWKGSYLNYLFQVFFHLYFARIYFMLCFFGVKGILKFALHSFFLRPHEQLDSLAAWQKLNFFKLLFLFDLFLRDCFSSIYKCELNENLLFLTLQ